MKIDNFVPFGRPQSGSVITQLMTELDNTKTAIPKPFRKQGNALILRRNAHILKIYNRCTALAFLSSTPYAVCIVTKTNER